MDKDASYPFFINKNSDDARYKDIIADMQYCRLWKVRQAVSLRLWI